MPIRCPNVTSPEWRKLEEDSGLDRTELFLAYVRFQQDPANAARVAADEFPTPAEAKALAVRVQTAATPIVGPLPKGKAAPRPEVLRGAATRFLAQEILEGRNVNEQLARNLLHSSGGQAAASELLRDSVALAMETHVRRAASDSQRALAVDIADTKADLARLKRAAEFVVQPPPLPPVPSLEARMESLTGIKNASVDAEIAALGLSPATHGEKTAFAQTLEIATDRLKADPQAGQNLVADLKVNMRAPTPDEDVLLTLEAVTIRNARKAAEDQQVAAAASGDAVAGTSAKVAAAAARDRYKDLGDVVTQAGTASSLSLSYRRLMLKDDYSLANLERQVLADLPRSTKPEDREAELDKARETAAEHERLTADIDKATKATAKERATVRERNSRKAIEDEITKLVSETDAAAKAGKTVDSAAGVMKALKSLRSAVDDAAGAPEMEDIHSSLRALALEFVRDGERTVDGLVAKVKAAIADILPDITPVEVRDGISGYGKSTQMNQELARVVLRDLSRQMQKLSALDRVRANIAAIIEKQKEAQLQPLPKSGLRWDKPSQVVRKLTKDLAVLMKRQDRMMVELGIKPRKTAAQLKSALDAVKTRLTNQIADIDKALATKTKMVSDKTPIVLDAEAKTLMAHRDKLQELYDEMFPTVKTPLTDAQRLTLAVRVTQRSADYWGARVAKAETSGDFTVTKADAKPLPPSKELADATAARDAVKAELVRLREIAFPSRSPEQKALDARKRRLAKRMDLLKSKIAEGDFEPTKRAEPVPDDRATLGLRAELQKVQDQWDSGRLTALRAKRAAWERWEDNLAGWYRAGLLSGPRTLGKLAAYSGLKLVEKPITEAVGGVVSELPGLAAISAKAPVEGGFNAQALAKYYSGFFVDGMKAAEKALREGGDMKSELERVYGRGVTVPPELQNFFGALHGVEKTPLRYGQFGLAFEKLMTKAIAARVDVTDPLVQVRMGKEAWETTDREVLMEQLRLSTKVREFMSGLEQPRKGETGAPFGTKTMATAARLLLPIVRVPTNFVHQTLERLFGAILLAPTDIAALMYRGKADLTPEEWAAAEGVSGKLAASFTRGVEMLSPQQADNIIRLIKIGTPGAAMMLYGFYNSDEFGGYIPGKRAQGDVAFGALRIAGYNVPSFVLHSPLIECAQVGASMHRAAYSYLRKTDIDPKGLPIGFLESMLGLIEQAPIANETTQLSKLFDARGREVFLGEMLRSAMAPQFAQNFAAWSDRDAQGNAIRRAPRTPWEFVKSGYPVLREQVSEYRPRQAIPQY